MQKQTTKNKRWALGSGLWILGIREKQTTKEHAGAGTAGRIFSRWRRTAQRFGGALRSDLALCLSSCCSCCCCCCSCRCTQLLLLLLLLLLLIFLLQLLLLLYQNVGLQLLYGAASC